MSKIKIAINGFGRIGRMFLRTALNNKNIEVVAINDLGEAATMAHLFKYDSVHGKFSGSISVKDNALVINGQSIKITSEKDVLKLPWLALDIDIVIESTGHHLDKE